MDEPNVGIHGALRTVELRHIRAVAAVVIGAGTEGYTGGAITIRPRDCQTANVIHRDTTSSGCVLFTVMEPRIQPAHGLD